MYLGRVWLGSTVIENDGKAHQRDVQVLTGRVLVYVNKLLLRVETCSRKLNIYSVELNIVLNLWITHLTSSNSFFFIKIFI